VVWFIQDPYAFPWTFLLFLLLQLYGLGLVTCSNYFMKLWIISTTGRTPWTGDQPDARQLLTQASTTQKNKHKHPCRKRNSNPGSQRPSNEGLRLRQRGHWDWLPWTFVMAITHPPHISDRREQSETCKLWEATELAWFLQNGYVLPQLWTQ
jgi:hypothetical protein